MPPLVENVKHNIEHEEECDEALDDQGVVGEAHHVVEDARDRRPEEVAGGEGGGEEARDGGLGVCSCGSCGPDS